MKRILGLLMVAGVVWLVGGCGPGGERCGKCGMLVDDHPRWAAGLVNAAGKEQRFCCPRCMFAHLLSARGAGSRDGWVTEYYSQKKAPVNEVFLVMGSDVTGPMGKALVPIRGQEAAEQFKKDHFGTRLLTASNITVEVMQEIAGKQHGSHSP